MHAKSNVLRWMLPATYSFGWAGSSSEISFSILFYAQETLKCKPSPQNAIFVHKQLC